MRREKIGQKLLEAPVSPATKFHPDLRFHPRTSTRSRFGVRPKAFKKEGTLMASIQGTLLSTGPGKPPLRYTPYLPLPGFRRRTDGLR